MIDDEESIRYAVDAELDFIGDFDVHFADDGRLGIERLRELSPDYVLVDLVLPSASGIEVLEAIRNDDEIRRPSRIVLMTGHSEPISSNNYEDFGIDRILAKPFRLDQLKDALFN